MNPTKTPSTWSGALTLLETAAKRGIAEGTLYYAKRALGVTSMRQSFHGPRIWELPEERLSKGGSPRPKA